VTTEIAIWLFALVLIIILFIRKWHDFMPSKNLEAIVTTETVQANILYGIGEGRSVADTDYLAYALWWGNIAYRAIINRPGFKSFTKKANFTMTDWQQTYQAPSDFKGFLFFKDETNGTELIQNTPEEFQREVSGKSITDETFTSESDVAVSLDNKAIVQYSEVVADDADHTTVYTRDTDYSMNYATGAITMDSTGSMVDDTEYYVDYLYHTKGSPNRFCMEYDMTNKLFVFRLDPVPNDSYIGTLLYPSFPSNLSDSVDVMWDRFELAVEFRGKYHAALEMLDPDDKRTSRFDNDSEKAIQALILLVRDLVPKHNRIEICMKKSDY